MIFRVLAFCLALQLTPGHVARVIDGDTFTLYHVGIPAEERVRLLNVDTPERGTPGFAEATQFTADWLRRGPFILGSCKRDGFGRLLAIVWRGSDTLNVAIVRLGHGAVAVTP